jgi:hypothetical protein
MRGLAARLVKYQMYTYTPTNAALKRLSYARFTFSSTRFLTKQQQQFLFNMKKKELHNIVLRQSRKHSYMYIGSILKGGGTVVWDPVIIIFEFFFSSKNLIGIYLSTLESVFCIFDQF